LQNLLRHVCANGFEHHVVMTQSKSAGVLREAFENYLGWDTYVHEDQKDD
jgi:L-fucose isomerase-like protein